MPTYEYKCQANGHQFDELQGFNSVPVAVCPVCGSQAARQISIPTVIYKGSGFYTTDYGGGKRNGPAKPESSEPSSSSTSDSGKSESKSSTKSSTSSTKPSSGD